MLSRRLFISSVLSLVVASPACAEGESNGKQGVYRLTLNDAIPAPVVSEPGLPFGPELIGNPGPVSYSGSVYDLTEEGLYAFFNGGDPQALTGGYRIVYESNIERLMSSLAWLTSFGYDDESLESPDVIEIMKTRTVALRCGPTCYDVVKPICDSLGIPCRVVHMVTAETPNGFDDGHVAAEVKIGGKWRLFDVTTDACFRDFSQGELLSLKEVVEDGVANVETVPLAPPQASTVGSEVRTETDVYWNIMFGSDASASAWRQRIYQIVGIDEGGKVYWKLPLGSEDRKQWVESLAPGGWFVLDPAEWDAKFYSA
jgi:hypothetical protein